MDAFVEFILAQDPFTVIVLLMVLSALENIFPPVPADVAGALGAFWAVRSGHMPAAMVGLLCFFANQVSAVWVYFWARSKGRAVLDSRIFRALLPAEMQPLVRAQIERWGVLGIFISRFLPGLRAGVLPFAAITGLSPARTLLPAALSSFIWYVGLTVTGSALGLAYEEVRDTVARVTGLLGVIGIALFGLAIILLWRAHRKRSAPDSEGRR